MAGRVVDLLGTSWGIVAFYVDGTTIPEVDWDVGPSWSGLLPISGDKDETRHVSVSICFKIGRASCRERVLVAV